MRLTEKDHPNLRTMLKLIADDNGMQMRRDIYVNADLDLYEAVASRIPGADYETFTCGEERDQEKICVQYNAWDLVEFLNQAFDGYLSEFIYED